MAPSRLPYLHRRFLVSRATIEWPKDIFLDCNQACNLIRCRKHILPFLSLCFWGSVFEQAAEEEINGLKTENNELQRRICILQKKRRSVNAEQFILEGQEAYYQAVSSQPKLPVWCFCQSFKDALRAFHLG